MWPFRLPREDQRGSSSFFHQKALCPSDVYSYWGSLSGTCIKGCNHLWIWETFPHPSWAFAHDIPYSIYRYSEIQWGSLPVASVRRTTSSAHVSSTSWESWGRRPARWAAWPGHRRRQHLFSSALPITVQLRRTCIIMVSMRSLFIAPCCYFAYIYGLK